jgi:WG containing repeat
MTRMSSFKRFCFIGLSIISASCSILTQIDPERAAATRISQKKWSAAESSLKKAFRKDTLNAEAKFVYAQFFLSEGNPSFNVDSSHAWVQRALTALAQTPIKQKERLQKLAIDSTAMLFFQTEVDSTAFETAKQQNTLQAYGHFLEMYPQAAERAKATELRDELAFVEALRANSAEGFRRYVSDYPGSHRAVDAEERYQLLVYQERTRSGTLKDYKAFLTEFPQSIYRDDAERLIFEVSTSSGLIDDYTAFISAYPKGAQTSKARNILYYLMREGGVDRPESFDSDSLRTLDERNKGYWIPFYKNGHYGFMNDDGVEVMEPKFESIDSTYLCGEVTQDFIVTSAGVYSRSGALLLHKTPTQAIDIGHGFLNIIDGECQTVVHQSGFQVGDNCLLSAKIVADQFIAVKQETGWSLYAFNHKLLLKGNYQDIASVDKLIVLKRYGKNIIVKTLQIAAVADAKQLDESLVFDEVRAWGEGNIWVKNGVLEGVMSQQLEFIIPLDRQVLTKTSFGFTRKKDSRIQITGITAFEGTVYEQVRDYGDWLELRSGTASTLYKVSQKKVVASGLDSVWINNRVAFGVRKDSLSVYAGSGKIASFERQSPVNFVRGRDSTVYFWVQDRRSRTVYEAGQGKKLFSTEFEDIEAISGDHFIFSRKNKKGNLKKGLIRRDGKIVQPAEYDVIVPTGRGYLSLLKDKKFGLYDIRHQKLIKPEYERNVLPYAGDYFIVYKGGYGLITSAQQAVTGFEFDEIRYWNDSSAWVKKNFAWSVYSIKDKQVRLARIRSFQTIKDTEEEKLFRIQQDNYFGVVSNRKGIVISPTFSEVINVGSTEKPFYFTEKRVEEAGIYVVIYYNSEGKFVRKQVYEDEEYEKIYCDQ